MSGGSKSDNNNDRPKMDKTKGKEDIFVAAKKLLMQSTSAKIGARIGDSEVNNLRLILPAFIEQEQKNSQIDRLRKIQSSPVKSLRRFSQGSDYLGRHLNVSAYIVMECGEIVIFSVFLLTCTARESKVSHITFNV